MNQYALPIGFPELKKIEAELEQQIELKNNVKDYGFILKEIKKVNSDIETLKLKLKSMTTLIKDIERGIELEAYIEKVVLPLPGQEIKETRYLVGVRTVVEEGKSSKRVENYYLKKDITSNWKSIAQDLATALTGRGKDQV